MKPFFVYMLRCADGSYYVGHTDDLEQRVAQHDAGEVPGYTRERRPVSLVWSQETSTREEALTAELRIKGWSRAKKEALIDGDWARVSGLARSRSGAAGEAGLRQAQPERDNGTSTSTRPELVEGPAGTRREPRLRRAQPERGTSTSTSVRPEPVEGSAGTRREPGLRQAQPERDTGTSNSVRPEPVEGPARVGTGEGPDTQRVLSGDRRALAKAITLVESTRDDHRRDADALLDALMPHTGRSLRIGISGVPGVGKSTFIEALGLYLVDRGHRVAVLAVDPSSSVSGGSILGDKTRMERLSVHPLAFIRPSPSGGTLGGVAGKTREAMLLAEAAGHDVVIVETVGVGQSETAVAGMTDLFVLLQLPNAGDDLQAIKRGVMELADLVVINKADLDPAAATRARAQITSALRHLGPHAHVPAQVLQLSALHPDKGTGLDEFWQAACRFRDTQAASGRFAARRHEQDEAWMWERIEAGLRERFRHHPAVRAALPAMRDDVRAGRTAASVAARRLLDLMR